VSRQLAGDQVGLPLGTANADGHVDGLVHQVDHGVAEPHVQFQLRVFLRQLGQQGRDVAVGQRDRRRDAQHPGGRGVAAGGGVVGLVQRGQNLGGLFKVVAAAIGEGDAAGGAVQQRRADARLERVDASPTRWPRSVAGRRPKSRRCWRRGRRLSVQRIYPSCCVLRKGVHDFAHIISISC
jgi:hypothetical protein